MKTGLVLEGGAMRGIFTCGVLDVFLENGITFEGAAGISAGAVFGCNFKSRQIGRTLRYNKRFCNDERYCSLKSLIKTGDMYNVDFCYHQIPDVLDVFDRKTYRENPMKFYVGATDVETGKPVYHLCQDGEENDMKWFQASASMPMVSRIVEVDGMKLLDGGIADSVPFAFLKSMGYDRQVIILTQAAGYRKKKASMLPLFKASLRKYPKAYEAVVNRHVMYNKEMEALDALEASGEALVIRPSVPLGISRTEKDPEELQRVYDMGREVALERLDEIKAFLSNKE